MPRGNKSFTFFPIYYCVKVKVDREAIEFDIAVEARRIRAWLNSARLFVCREIKLVHPQACNTTAQTKEEAHHLETGGGLK